MFLFWKLWVTDTILKDMVVVKRNKLDILDHS